jgi:hypothetical protein
MIVCSPQILLLVVTLIFIVETNLFISLGFGSADLGVAQGVRATGK